MLGAGFWNVKQVICLQSEIPKNCCEWFPARTAAIRNLGFVTPTEARRITFEETLRFEKIHEDIYRDFGFELVSVEPGSPVERVSIIKAAML